MKRVIAASEEPSPTMFYKLTVDDVLPVLQEDKDNLILCHQLEQEGWGAIRVERHLFGSEVVGEFLYLCVPGRDDVEINGRILDPEEILDVITVDELPEDMVSETCEPGIIRGFISNYELNPPMLNDVAFELLEEGHDFVDILRSARDVYKDLDL